ncbi:MAG: beta-galactosidase trimerization domain-containing protein, partial [Hyphomicrobium sp.]|uniref:beta-galactosidase trimerization domain-containing protein n=1 Tax=Hyphomicrobium sp. TaxID=82 RepID=UPI0035673B3E
MYRRIHGSILAGFIVLSGFNLFAENTALNDDPSKRDSADLHIENGAFMRDGQYEFFTGPFCSWAENVSYDRRGPWSKNRAYGELIDRNIMADFGFNTYQPINFVTYFIMKKYYPEMLQKDHQDYYSNAENIAAGVLKRMSPAPIFMDYSDIALYLGIGRKAKGVIPDAYFQKNGWWDNFFPFDPSYPQSMELYKTMYEEATKFVLDHGGNPVVYELLNEPFYNSFSPENMTLFKSWLKQKYITVGSANEIWGSSYSSFEDAAAKVETIQDNDPGLWYDWMYFQSELLAGYLKDFKGFILNVDNRKTPKYFTYQPQHQMPSMAYNTAFNYTFYDFMDVVGVEYTGLHLGMGTEHSFDGSNMMEAGYAARNDTFLFGAALAKAYSKGRPIVDFEMRCCRYENGKRVTSWDDDLESALWSQTMHGFSGSILYTWGSRGQEWKTYEEAKASALSAPYKEACLLNPYNYTEKALFGLRRFRDSIEKLKDIVMPCPRVVGKVGVLYLDHQSWQLAGRESTEYMYSQQSLRDIQMPFDFIVAEFCKNDQDIKYPLLICPELEYVSGETKAILKSYVKNGGTLVVFPGAFSHNEYGRPADGRDITGVEMTPLAKEQAGEIILNNEKNIGLYAQKAAATPITAKAYALFKSGEPAIYVNTLGKGKVYSLLFSKGKENLGAVYDAICESENVQRDFFIAERDSGKLDNSVTLDVINRGDTQFLHAFNWTYCTKAGRLYARNLPAGPVYVYDAVTWKSILSPSGKETWTPEEVKDGIDILLPRQTRALYLISKKKSPYTDGQITEAEITALAEKESGADTAYLKELAEGSGARKQKETEQRTFRGVDPKCAFFVDLRKYANMGFEDDVPHDGKGGWTDQGKANDMCYIPTGKQTFYGVPYDIIDPAKNNGRSAVILKGGDSISFPQEVRGITVEKKAAALFFLHGAGWVRKAPLFEYRINYEDSSSKTLQILPGKGAADWWKPRDESITDPACRIAWIGNNLSSEVGLYTYKWENPKPDLKIKSIDIISYGTTIP